MGTITNALVSCEWLLERLDCPNQLILDATFFLPRQQRNAKEEFNVQHIPGAHYFDIDTIADLSSQLPHTLPGAAQFARQVSQLGVDANTRVIIYDNNHFFAAARVWWMFRVFGHDKVNILDGGLNLWQKRLLPLTEVITTVTPRVFNTVFRPELFVDLQKNAAYSATSQQANIGCAFRGQF